jgi:hypothetical protein
MNDLESDGFKNQKQLKRQGKGKEKSLKKSRKILVKYMIFIEKISVFGIIKE